VRGMLAYLVGKKQKMHEVQPAKREGADRGQTVNAACPLGSITRMGRND
jgi:hypothetical protein